MYPMLQFMDRFGGILAELDELAAKAAGEAAEALEDQNAELEDALMLLGELKPDDADDAEELAGTLEDLRALAEDYRDLSEAIPGLSDLADRLDMNATLALNSLEH